MRRYTINFYEFDMVERRWNKELGDYRFYPVPIKRVAMNFGILKSDIFQAFEQWQENEYPQTYRHKIEEKKYLEIWFKPDVLVQDGTISLVRTWGKGWRSLKPYISMGFTLEFLL